MSSRMRGENEINNIVRRVANIPRNLLGGFSRAMNQGIDLIGGRRNYNHHHHDQTFHSQQPLNFPFQETSNIPLQHPPMVQEEWAFLASFEQQYGTMHPFFYACRFTDASKIADDERKLMFVYIHSPEHPFTPSFCRETLCSELIVQFLDANFVCWAGLAGRGEGLQMANALRVSSFPFCAVVSSPAAGDNLSVLQQLEGPVSPAELVEILQKTMDEQGVAFGSGRYKQEETRRANQRLREEQDVAYVAALQIDQERERLHKKPSSEDRDSKPGKNKESSASKQPNKAKQVAINGQTSQKANTSEVKRAEVTQILIRFPNGERKEHSFLCTDKIKAIYGYIDSLGLAGVENYRLISNFPRKVYGIKRGATITAGPGPSKTESNHHHHFSFFQSHGPNSKGLNDTPKSHRRIDRISPESPPPSAQPLARYPSSFVIVHQDGIEVSPRLQPLWEVANLVLLNAATALSVHLIAAVYDQRRRRSSRPKPRSATGSLLRFQSPISLSRRSITPLAVRLIPTSIWLGFCRLLSSHIWWLSPLNGPPLSVFVLDCYYKQISQMPKFNHNPNNFLDWHENGDEFGNDIRVEAGHCLLGPLKVDEVKDEASVRPHFLERVFLWKGCDLLCIVRCLSSIMDFVNIEPSHDIYGIVMEEGPSRSLEDSSETWQRDIESLSERREKSRKPNMRDNIIPRTLRYGPESDKPKEMTGTAGVNEGDVMKGGQTPPPVDPAFQGLNGTPPPSPERRDGKEPVEDLESAEVVAQKAIHFGTKEWKNLPKNKPCQVNKGFLEGLMYFVPWEKQEELHRYLAGEMGTRKEKKDEPNSEKEEKSATKKAKQSERPSTRRASREKKGQGKRKHEDTSSSTASTTHKRRGKGVKMIPNHHRRQGRQHDKHASESETQALETGGESRDKRWDRGIRLLEICRKSC
ncbi:fas-associated factor 2-b [Phtheirospermum japonicum]|uniref:Fas-associated factor 2-b n=1 Tax=Phtheirospermum japonicum TaxID=374723 RepID=A0A830C3H5_9LAMI|nr:fas-associated factor 2-b [Phtheirospermum japonicum]